MEVLKKAIGERDIDKFGDFLLNHFSGRKDLCYESVELIAGELSALFSDVFEWDYQWWVINDNTQAKTQISYKGARMIHDAYSEKWRSGQKMEEQNDRGGIAYFSEINSYIKDGLLPKDFSIEDYKIPQFK